MKNLFLDKEWSLQRDNADLFRAGSIPFELPNSDNGAMIHTRAPTGQAKPTPGHQF